MFDLDTNPAGVFSAMIVLVFIVFFGWWVFGVNKVVKAEEQ